MSDVNVGLQMMLFGMTTTFSILIIFYFLIKALSKFFPEDKE